MNINIVDEYISVIQEGIFSKKKARKLYMKKYNSYADSINQKLKACEDRYGGSEATSKEVNHYCYYKAVVSAGGEFVKSLSSGCGGDEECRAILNRQAETVRAEVMKAKQAVEQYKKMINKD